MALRGAAAVMNYGAAGGTNQRGNRQPRRTVLFVQRLPRTLANQYSVQKRQHVWRYAERGAVRQPLVARRQRRTAQVSANW